MLGALPALAALGDTVESVATDQKMLRASIKVSQANGYTVHEMTADNGVVVNEYVSTAGKVFGVSWKGSTMPDLSQLFGLYFQEFRASLPGKARRHAAVRSGNLVVDSRGHQRDFSGRAYVTSLLPAGVCAEVIQ